MKLVRFELQGASHHGLLERRSVTPIRSYPAMDGKLDVIGSAVPLDSVRLLAPARPSNIVTVLLEEGGLAGPGMHQILMLPKPASAAAGPEEIIRLPREGKTFGTIPGIALVVRETCRNLSRSQAGSAILGYTCFNNFCATDIYERNQSWVNASGFDSFAPFGPAIETQLPPSGAEIRLTIDNETVERVAIDPDLFDPAGMLAFVSQVMTLLPGDLITSGRRGRFHNVSAGQKLAVTIDGIGTLGNPVAERAY